MKWRERSTNAKKYLEDHPEITAEIEKKVRNNFSEAFEKSLGDEEVDPEQEKAPEEEEN